MTFENIDGILIVKGDGKTIASTPAHTIEKTGNNMRLTFNCINLEFTEDDILFDDLVKLLPK